MQARNIFFPIVLFLLTVFLSAASFAGERGLVVRETSDFHHGSKRLGAFKALIIGINDYTDPKIPDLATAEADARAMAGVLKKDYGFSTTLLLNKDATKSNIYLALRKLAQETKKGDSVLSYYGGHGDLDKVYNDGWWIPADARSGDPMSYLDNVQVKKAMRSMKARHVLLISDSCYSGTLFGSTRSLPPVIDSKHYLGLYNDRSRWGLTSGNREPVADAGSGKHSIFAGQLLKELRRGDRAFFSIRDVYTHIAPIIANNSEQHPICRPMQGVGDGGGEFVFVRLAGGKVVTDKPLKGASDTQAASGVVEKKSGMLTVRTSPPKAVVYVNGANEGVSPVRIQNLTPGIFTLVAKKKGYLDQKEKTRVRADRSTDVLLVLDAVAIAMGRLYVRVTPSDAQIRLLNIEPRYAEGMELEPGRYHLEVSRKNHHSVDRWVELQADKELTIEITLQEKKKEVVPKEIIKEVVREKVVIKEVIVEVPREIIVEVPMADMRPSGPFLGPRWTEPTTGMDFIWIEDGCFMMGSPAEEAGRDRDEQHHKVCLDGFYLGKYEVTQGQWQEVMSSNPAKFQGDVRLPVEQISWDGVEAFLEKLSNEEIHFRLPGEAEWEYAARAGSATPFAYGDTLPPGQANYNGNRPYGSDPKGEYLRKTIPVGSYPSNGWGLHDMHGNVWELVGDWYGGDYYGSSPEKNPPGPPPSMKRVKRGGCYYSSAKGCRSANRDWSELFETDDNLGFRVVLEAAE